MVFDSLHAPPHPLGYTSLPMTVLREEVPPEIRHEETHIHPHRQVYVRNCSVLINIPRCNTKYVHCVNGHLNAANSDKSCLIDLTGYNKIKTACLPIWFG